MMRSLALGAVLLLAAPVAVGQASSPNFKLTEFGFNGAGGGESSVAGAGWASMGQLSSDEMLSLNFRTVVGLMGTVSPKPIGNAPTLYGIEPAFGPKAGGTVITVNGMNFDVAGSAVFDSMLIGGNLVTGLTVLSNTELTGVVPAGTGTNGGSGPQMVDFIARFGSVQMADGFINTPAVTSSPVSLVGETMRLNNYGPTTDFFRCFVSTATTFGNTKYGKLLIGPFPLIEVLFLQPYPGPDGVQKLELDVPDDPILNGVTVYFQTLDVTGFGPLTGQLTNRSSTTFP